MENIPLVVEKRLTQKVTLSAEPRELLEKCLILKKERRVNKKEGLKNQTQKLVRATNQR
jgi:hypothetical protein